MTLEPPMVPFTRHQRFPLLKGQVGTFLTSPTISTSVHSKQSCCPHRERKTKYDVAHSRTTEGMVVYFPPYHSQACACAFALRLLFANNQRGAFKNTDTRTLTPHIHTDTHTHTKLSNLKYAGVCALSVRFEWLIPYVSEARMVVDKRYRCPANWLYSTTNVVLILAMALYVFINKI